MAESAKFPFNRRLFLHASAAVAAPSALPPQAGPGGTAPVRPFPLRDVRLGAGLLSEERDRVKAFLRAYDEKRFLVLFNNQAGRPNPPGVAVPGGWEDGGLLSGHWAGHCLTALAQAHADGGEAVYKDKLDWVVAELAACQAAITARMGAAPGGGGDEPAPPVGRVAGRFGSGLRLNGPSRAQYCTLPQEMINQLTDFTIAAWVDLASPTAWSRLFDFGQNTAVTMFLTPRAGVAGDVPRFAIITTSGSGGEQRIDGDAALPTGRWVHIAVTPAGTTGVLHVDGRPDSPAGTTGGGGIAWYRFDETGGTTLEDASPNNRDAGVVAATSGGAADWVPTFPGYLGAIPEDAVLRLGPPRWAVYGGNAQTNTWAPWYTQHKIMRGLLDAYRNTDNAQALEVVTEMADWAHLALTVGDKNHPAYEGPLTRDDLNHMGDLHIGGEFGGANEVFPEIGHLTGDPKHLATAKCFDNRESLFDACVADRDILVVTPQNRRGREYFTAAKNFFGMAVPHRVFAHGGAGGNYPGSNNNLELFQNRGNVANAVATSGAETCTTYNLPKLSRNLFLHEHDPAYTDYYERGLLNMIAGSRADTTRTNDPQVTYFQPVGPGATRSYGNTGTCCGGTGLENHTKYQETVFFRSADDSALWVNLYAPATLDWAERGVTVTVTVNGRRQDLDARPGTYVTLSRDWARGDVVEVRMPFSVRIERAVDRPDTQAVFCGPVLLQVVGDPGGGAFRELSLYRHLKRDGDYGRAAITAGAATAAGDPTFTAGGFALRPYCTSDGQAASSYSRRVEPTVVFGSTDTGVPNRKRDDGLPHYDVPVQGITSPGDDGPTFLDLLWDRAPFANHGRFVAAATALADAFAAAGAFTGAERDVVVATAASAARELSTTRFDVRVEAGARRVGANATSPSPPSTPVTCPSPSRSPRRTGRARSRASHRASRRTSPSTPGPSRSTR
ncbi:beta-L-arabinofuranosidase domain-containing protein [Saccharothrix sp. HUAS TT1]|uniref:beta-L-arabinofuranosidase domain-containing protein n=1 Tax=unclassified Saccharothrix TaxID=2593673 RepID=UPI00345BBB78